MCSYCQNYKEIGREMREGVLVVVANDEQSPRDVVGTFRDDGRPREEPQLFVDASFDGATDRHANTRPGRAPITRR